MTVPPRTPNAPEDHSPEGPDRYFLGLALEQARIGWE